VRDDSVTFAVDVGGTGIKGALLDAQGTMIGKRVKQATAYPMPPEGERSLLEVIARLLRKAEGQPTQLAVGFPGMVRKGVILTAPHFESSQGLGGKPEAALVEAWRNFPLQDKLVETFGLPARAVNDAEMQGLAAISHHGLEVVATLGTGFGFACYDDGVPIPHLELGGLPAGAQGTFDSTCGVRSLRRLGTEAWNLRVANALNLVFELTRFDRCYLGGGNARQVDLTALGSLANSITVVGNIAGILGGHYLFAGALSNSTQRVGA